jgi:hypothetical protein
LWALRPSLVSSQQIVVPGFAFPTVGPLGLSSPPTSTDAVCCIRNRRVHIPCGTMLSYNYPSSLSVPSLFACPRYLSCLSFVSRWGLELLFPTPGVFSLDRLPLTDVQEPADCSQSDVLPSCPIKHMPRSQTPVVSCSLALSLPGLLPSSHCIPSAFPLRFAERLIH